MCKSAARGTKALLMTAWQNGPRKARKLTWIRTASLSHAGQFRGSTTETVSQIGRFRIGSVLYTHWIVRPSSTISSYLDVGTLSTVVRTVEDAAESHSCQASAQQLHLWPSRRRWRMPSTRYLLLLACPYSTRHEQLIVSDLAVNQEKRDGRKVVAEGPSRTKRVKRRRILALFYKY